MLLLRAVEWRAKRNAKKPQCQNFRLVKVAQHLAYSSASEPFQSTAEFFQRVRMHRSKGGVSSGRSCGGGVVGSTVNRSTSSCRASIS